MGMAPEAAQAVTNRCTEANVEAVQTLVTALVGGSFTAVTLRKCAEDVGLVVHAQIFQPLAFGVLLKLSMAADPARAVSS